MADFEKISRWLYRYGPYTIRAITTSAHGKWRVTRNGSTLGFAGSLEGATAIVNSDMELAASPNGYLTDGHRRATMVPEVRDDERISSVTEFNTCKCYSIVSTDDNGGKVHRSCGSTISKRRTFKPGHDAKLKSVLQAAFRNGEDFTYEEDGIVSTVSPVDLAEERGWGHFMTPKPKKTKKAKADGKDNTGVDHADDQPDIEEKAGFHPARVKVGRWWKDGHIVSENRSDGTVTVAYSDKKGDHEVTLDKDDEKLEIG